MVGGLYFYSKNIIMKDLVEFAAQYGIVQNTLLRELSIPYAILLDDGKAIWMNDEFEAKAVILATGNKKSKPNIKNIDYYEGKGISYCAVCDGFFYKNKDVAVIGNGDYAISEAMDLQNIAKSITILTNGRQAPEYRTKNVDVNTKEIREIRRRKQGRRN